MVMQMRPVRATPKGTTAQAADKAAIEQGKTLAEYLPIVKARLREQAMRTAERHGYCDVVEQTLEAAGFTPVMKSVSIEGTVPIKAVVHVDEEAWAGMSEEQRTTYLNDQIQPVVSINNNGLAMTGTLVVLGVTEAEPGTALAGPPDGYVERYANSRGQVLHYYPDNGRNRSSMCGRLDYQYNLTTDSNRGTGETCGRCMKAAGQS